MSPSGTFFLKGWNWLLHLIEGVHAPVVTGEPRLLVPQIAFDVRTLEEECGHLR